MAGLLADEIYYFTHVSFLLILFFSIFNANPQPKEVYDPTNPLHDKSTKFEDSSIELRPSADSHTARSRRRFF